MPEIFNPFPNTREGSTIAKRLKEPLHLIVTGLHFRMTKPTGIKRLIKATHYSMQGLASCFRTEEAFRLESILAVILTPVGLWLGETGAEKALLAGSVLLLMVVEIMNTAIERVVDRISPDLHVLSGEAKDMGSAAVLITFCIAVMTWTLILFV